MIPSFINPFIVKLSCYALYILIRLRLYFLCAIIIFFNLRKFKSVKNNTLNKSTKVIILSKSGGVDDLKAAFENKSNNHYEFFELPRILIKYIYFYFMKDQDYEDYFTRDTTNEVTKRKTEYKNFMLNVFKKLNSLIDYKALVSFNIFYFAENDLPQPIQKLGKKYLVIHKESVNSQEESLINFENYKKHNKRFFGDKIAVYCENEKKILIDSNVLSPEQIEVVGCSRSDFSYQMRKIKPIGNQIVYFMIENNRSITEEQAKGKLVDWKDLIMKTQDYLIEYSKKNPNIEIIFKGKKNVHLRSDLPKNLPKNCRFSFSNSGHKFLENAKVVIAFNSTILFEAILANRNILIPIFGIDVNKLDKLIYKSPNFFVDNKDIFFQKIDNFVNNDYYQIKELNEEEKNCVQFYLGNSDGKSGERLRNFFDKNLI
jgi:hypothetical protein